MKDEQTQQLDYVLRLRDIIKELEKENKRLQSDLENEKAARHGIVSQDFQEIIHELFQVNKQLREALEEMLETVYWMSGSSDFSSEGQAHEGWVKVQPKIEKARKALEEGSD